MIKNLVAKGQNKIQFQQKTLNISIQKDKLKNNVKKTKRN